MRISPPSIPAPTLGTVSIPAATKSSASLAMSPSHPFAATTSIVTGRYSVWFVMELNTGTWPSGKTLSGVSANTDIWLLEKPNGGTGGLIYRLRLIKSAEPSTWRRRPEEQVRGSELGGRMLPLNQSMKSVLLRTASDKRELGWESPQVQRSKGTGLTKGRRPS